MGEKGKVYTKKSILLATILGTPLAGSYLMGKNFAVWEELVAAKISYTLGIISTIFILTAFLYIPSEVVEKIPTMLVPLIYAVIIERLVAIYQQDNIDEHLKNEDLKESNWKATGIGVMGSIITAILFFGLGFTQPLYPGHVKEYGPQSNQIFFDDGINPLLADKLEQPLKEYGIFSNDFQNAAHIGKRDEYYVVTIPLPKEGWDDKKLEKGLYLLKDNLKSKFSTKWVIIRLHHFGFNDEFKEL